MSYLGRIDPRGTSWDVFERSDGKLVIQAVDSPDVECSISGFKDDEEAVVNVMYAACFLNNQEARQAIFEIVSSWSWEEND